MPGQEVSSIRKRSVDSIFLRAFPSLLRFNVPSGEKLLRQVIPFINPDHNGLFHVRSTGLRNTVSRSTRNRRHHGEDQSQRFVQVVLQSPGLGGIVIRSNRPFQHRRGLPGSDGTHDVRSGKAFRSQMPLWEDYMGLWQNTARSLAGEEVAPAFAPEKNARR